jgi:hypothetical protein
MYFELNISKLIFEIRTIINVIKEYWVNEGNVARLAYLFMRLCSKYGNYIKINNLSNELPILSIWEE